MKIVILVKAGSYDTHEKIEMTCGSVNTDDSGRIAVKDDNGNLIGSFKWDHVHGWYRVT